MLETLSLQNFKGFETLDKLPLKPVTILCGTNSSGKSTILQSALLLKQTLESQTPNQTLLLNGRFVHLGSFEDIIHNHDNERHLKFALELKFERGDRFQDRRQGVMPTHFAMRELLGKEDAQELHLQFNVSVKSLRQNIEQTQLGALQVDSLEGIFHETGAPSDAWGSIRLDHSSDEQYKVSWKNIPPWRSRHSSQPLSGESTGRFNFANFVPVGLRFINDKQADEPVMEVMGPLYGILELLKSTFSSFTYLGPLREEPRRRYIYEDEVIEIGIKGENAPYIYLAERNRVLRNTHFYDSSAGSFLVERSLSLENAVRRWLEGMTIHNFSPQQTREIIYVNLSAGPERKTQVNIADVGFGVSQIFPIILEGLRMPHRATLLLEQPEIHLHPNLQMQLADYFISLALSGKNVIVETHSDHVVNRLVRRIVEDSDRNLRDLIAIYFVKNLARGSIFEPIEIDSRRGIANWPANFFDQNAIEQEHIIKAGLRKRQGKVATKG